MNVSSSCVICGSALPVAVRWLRRTCEGGRCQVVYREHLEGGRGVCGVCGRPLGEVAVAGETLDNAVRTCGDLMCRRAVAFLITASGGEPPSRCEVCRMLLPAERRGERTCGCRECAEVQFRRDAAGRAAERARHVEEVSRLAQEQRAGVARREDVAEQEAYPISVVPSFSRGLSDLPSDRRETFAHRLRGIIDDVFAEPFEPEGARQPVVEQSAGEANSQAGLFAAACGLCRGHCCRNGGEHAYISAETIRRFRERTPEAGPEDVAAAYLRHLPSRTFTDSCVFHTERGCALPGEMRSATCNAFLCPGLQELRNELAAGAPPRALFASADEDTLIAMTFVDAAVRREAAPE